ncbi:hypothetical protein, partial [Komagataeibacter intermedius]
YKLYLKILEAIIITNRRILWTERRDMSVSENKSSNTDNSLWKHHCPIDEDAPTQHAEFVNLSRAMAFREKGRRRTTCSSVSQCRSPSSIPSRSLKQI